MPGPVSPISTTAQSPSRPVRRVSVPVAVHRVERVVDQVGPHLVELAGVGRDLRQRAVVLLDHRDAGGDLGAEHDQRRVEPGVQVGRLVRRPVHLRVLLGGVDQRRDAVGAVGDLAQQRLGLDACRPASAAPARGSVGATASATSSRSPSPEPGRDEDPGELPPLGDVVVLEPVAELVLAVGALDAVSSAPRRRCARRTPPGARSSERSSSPSSSPSREQRQLVPHAGEPLAQRGGGPDGGGRGVVQLVGEPGGQLPEREQPLALRRRSRRCCAGR